MGEWCGSAVLVRQQGWRKESKIMGKRWPKGIGEIFDLYIKEKEQFGLSEIKFLERALSCLLAAVGDIEELSVVDAEQFRSYLVESGLSRADVETYFKRVSSFFGWAVRRGFMERDPFGALRSLDVVPRNVEIFIPEGVEQGFGVHFEEVWKTVSMLGWMLVDKGEGLDVTVNGNDLHGKVIFVPTVPWSVFAGWRRKWGCKAEKQTLSSGQGEFSWVFYERQGSGHRSFCRYFLN